MQRISTGIASVTKMKFSTQNTYTLLSCSARRRQRRGGRRRRGISCGGLALRHYMRMEVLEHLVDLLLVRREPLEEDDNLVVTCLEFRKERTKIRIIQLSH